MARGTDSETNDVTETTDDTTKIVHMTEGQLQSMLENVFTLSMSKMKDYADAISTKVDKKVSDVVAALEAKITAAATEHITEDRLNEIISGAIADANIPVVHTVTFDAGPGTLTGVESMKVLDGGLIPEVSAPKPPSNTSMWFICWRTSDGSTEWDFDNNTVTADITLVANFGGDSAPET